MTRLTLAIFVDSLDRALARAAKAAEHGADLVEYRVDRLAEDPAWAAELLERSPLPCVFTCRAASEGGLCTAEESRRIELYELALTATRPPAYLDLELAAYRADPRWADMLGRHLTGDPAAPTTGLILSTHDFQRRPDDLLRRVADMAQAPAARVLKAAWHARSLRDNLQAFELIAGAYKPTIALCMGGYGLPSRVLAGKFGALLTFAALDADQATAPGQPTLDELKNLYRWDAIGKSTAVFGVIGDPVGHSLSPHIHNAAFTAAGHDAVYLPLPIPPAYEHFKATVSEWLAFEGLHFRGASVTIPHKRNLLRFVAEQGGEVEPLAQKIGAANTLTRREDQSLYASNTDYGAALDAVCARLGIRRAELAGKRVAVIGAGGAARAIVAGFAHHGAAVTIHNRTLDKARALALAFADEPGEVTADALDALGVSDAQVVINATPIGMHPRVEDAPLAPDAAIFQRARNHRARNTPPADEAAGASKTNPAQAMGTPEGTSGDASGGTSGDASGGVVFDTIYNPRETRLLRVAREAGCVTIPGTEMFIRQGAAQFELWTGKPAPLNVFREAMMRQLG